MPTKLKAPALNAKDGMVAIEEFQLAYESLRLVKPGTLPMPDSTKLAKAQLLELDEKFENPINEDKRHCAVQSRRR